MAAVVHIKGVFHFIIMAESVESSSDHSLPEQDIFLDIELEPTLKKRDTCSRCK